jgi:hypothetical protein
MEKEFYRADFSGFRGIEENLIDFSPGLKNTIKDNPLK